MTEELTRITPTEIIDILNHIIKPLKGVGFRFKQKEIELSTIEAIRDSMWDYEDESDISFVFDAVGTAMLPRDLQPDNLTDDQFDKIVEGGVAKIIAIQSKRVRNAAIRERKRTSNLLLRRGVGTENAKLPLNVVKRITNFVATVPPKKSGGGKTKRRRSQGKGKGKRKTRRSTH